VILLTLFYNNNSTQFLVTWYSKSALSTLL